MRACNIHNLKREDIEKELNDGSASCKDDVGKAYYDELRWRDEQAANAKAASDLLEATKAQNAAILQQNDRHHVASLAQKGDHAALFLDEVKEANRVAKWALFFVCLAAIIGGITGAYVERLLDKENRPQAAQEQSKQIKLRPIKTTSGTDDLDSAKTATPQALKQTNPPPMKVP